MPSHLEGGVRVNAFIRWKGVLAPGLRAQDIVHVSDLFTTFARLAGAEEHIPTDRVIDGVDQTPVLFLGETHGRRDYVFVYEGPRLRSIVKQESASGCVYGKPNCEDKKNTYFMKLDSLMT